MKTQVSIINSSNFRQLITWESFIAIKDGYCSFCRPNDEGEAQAQYSMAPVYIPGTGNFSENTNATPITNAQMLKIASLQFPNSQFTIDQQMNWAMDGGNNTWGQIMRASYLNGSLWRDATNIKMIAAVYAGETVEILEYRDILLRDFDGGIRMTPMARIRTFQPDEWGDEGSMQYVTAVTVNNKHGYSPKGMFRMPIYFGNREAWVFARWLKP